MVKDTTDAKLAEIEGDIKEDKKEVLLKEIRELDREGTVPAKKINFKQLKAVIDKWLLINELESLC